MGTGTERRGGMSFGFQSSFHDLAATFRAAAAALESGQPTDTAAGDLLVRLGYRSGSPAKTINRAALLRAAASFPRVFLLAAPDAPGLIALGAEVDPAVTGAAGQPLGGVSGTGLDFRTAFESCIGEGVEYLSQFAAPDDPVEHLLAEVALADASPAMRDLWVRLQPRSGEAGWMIAADLADGHPVRVPADLCIRRDPAQRDFAPPWPMSIGCGAGPDLLAATLHGLLELIERDAASLWARGGRQGRMIAPDSTAASEATRVLTRLRGEATDRRTWLIDITSDLGIPVVAALACNDDGFGLCCGLAARPTMAGAARAALFELVQMELAWRVVQTKKAHRGDDALNATDRLHERRYTTLAVPHCTVLHPLAPPAAPHDLPSSDTRATLAAIRARLAAAGLAPCVVNLTRLAFGIPVVRVLCPGLEAGDDAPDGPRLKPFLARKSRAVHDTDVAPSPWITLG